MQETARPSNPAIKYVFPINYEGAGWTMTLRVTYLSVDGIVINSHPQAQAEGGFLRDTGSECSLPLLPSEE